MECIFLPLFCSTEVVDYGKRVINMPITKYGSEYSYLLCCGCEMKFDGDPIPEKCPYCGAKKNDFHIF